MYWRYRSDWITHRTWKMIGSREDAKKKVNEAKSLRLKEIHQKAYSKIQKEMKVLRTDKRANRDELATKGEEAAK